MLRFEEEAWTRGARRVGGLDEAGRGPLAGPVVAACVVWPAAVARAAFAGPLRGLTDSKQLSPAHRERFFAWLTAGQPDVDTAIASAEADEIDRLNILRATHLAMARALAALPRLPEFVLVDGLPVPGLPAPSRAIVHGDGLSLTIAAASVLAKVTRDRRMIEADQDFPGYGFARHKGYGTAAHVAALRRLGPCPLHRRSFAPVAAAAVDPGVAL